MCFHSSPAACYFNHFIHHLSPVSSVSAFSSCKMVIFGSEDLFHANLIKKKSAI